MVICICNNINESVIIEAIQNGIVELDDLKELLNVSTCCRTCEDEVILLLEKYVDKS